MGTKSRASYERRRWTPSLAAFGGRRSRQSYDYFAFIPDRIGPLDLRLPTDIASVVTEAEVAIRELNQRVLGLGALEALARQLLRAEAVASSRIEGLEMSHRRLARAAFAPEEADAHARTVVGNVRAMEAAIALGAVPRRLTVADIIALHATLFRGTPEEPRAGQIRTTQNWIGGRDVGPRDAEFVPPNENLVVPLLEDLCDFLDRDDVPAVAQAAIAHAQFETIHPFADGNGRIGRALIHVLLRRLGIAPNYVPPVSLILATDQKAYIRGLTAFREYTDEGMGSWVATFAQAMRSAAREAVSFAEEIAELQRRWRERAGLRRSGSAAEKIIAMLPAQPVLDVKAAAEDSGVVYEAARLAVEQLERAGVVRQVSARRRDRLFEAPDLFALIDGFERRLATPAGATRPARPAPRPRTVAVRRSLSSPRAPRARPRARGNGGRSGAARLRSGSATL